MDHSFLILVLECTVSYDYDIHFQTMTYYKQISQILKHYYPYQNKDFLRPVASARK